MQAFVKRVRALNYGNCYYFETAQMEDLNKLDVEAACEHFNQCYRNPAEFTICLTGQIEVNAAHTRTEAPQGQSLGDPWKRGHSLLR